VVNRRPHPDAVALSHLATALNTIEECTTPAELPKAVARAAKARKELTWVDSSAKRRRSWTARRPNKRPR
jgi:hypothetical protein